MKVANMSNRRPINNINHLTEPVLATFRRRLQAKDGATEKSSRDVVVGILQKALDRVDGQHGKPVELSQFEATTILDWMRRQR